jgi:hypothetical protein
MIRVVTETEVYSYLDDSEGKHDAEMFCKELKLEGIAFEIEIDP